MGKTTLAAIGTTVVLAILYFAAFPSAARGYGYAGYGGHPRPSFWYWGGPPVFSNPSAREGSLGGPGHRGGGLAGGK